MNNLINELHFDQEGREKLLSGIKKISKAVKSTLGPRGRTVIIESPNHTHGITVTKDGVTVAKSINVEDPVEALALQIIREASERTALDAGDGTTSSMIMAEAMTETALRLISTGDVNPWSVVESIKLIAADIEQQLIQSSIPIDDKSLLRVATISANNDDEIGRVVAEAYEKAGKNGLVNVQNSQDHNTYVEGVKGIKIDRGYSSDKFVNNQKRDECLLEDPLILITDVEIDSVLRIENVLKKVVQERRPLLFIAPLSQDMIKTLAMNVVKGGLKFCVIEPPQFGYKSKEMMADIALATGGKFFDQDIADDLSLITEEDLGRAKRVVVGRTSTSIVPTSETPSEIIENTIKDLEVQKKEEKDIKKAKFIGERIALLSGGVSTIFVGGTSDVDQKERFDRFDDAVCSVRSAVEEGIVVGGGKALLNAVIGVSSQLHTIMDSGSQEQKIAAAVINAGCSSPMNQLLINAGLSPEDVDSTLKAVAKQTEHGYQNSGMDVKSMQMVDLMESGIIDPLKVVRRGFLNAVSVATTMINTNAIITVKRA